MEFASPRNPLGVKGLGEGGAISPPAAIAGAVEDALDPLGVRITEVPVTAPRLFALLRAREPRRGRASGRRRGRSGIGGSLHRPPVRAP